MNLKVRIVNGHASSTVLEPYFLPVPESLKESMGNNATASMAHFGVIDTQTPASLERFRAYNSFFWVSENALVVRDQQGGARISPFSPNFNYTVNEGVLQGLIASAQPFFKFVAPLVILIVFFCMLLLSLIKIVYLVFAAVLVFVLGRVLKHQWTYGTAFRISLHAVTLPLLLSTALSLVNLDLDNLPFLATALLLAVVYINFRNIPPEVAVLPAEAPSPTLDSK